MTTAGSGPAESGGFQLPWTAIPRFSPGVTDVTEYSGKLQLLAAMWPQEHLHLLAPRAALLCKGTAFKKVSKIPADKLKSSDESGVKLLVATLGGSWGKTALEEKYDTFEKAIYSTSQKADETNDSYLARHDVHFEELLAQGSTTEEVRAYVLLRQSQLSAEDRKKIVVEMGGKLEYSKVVSAIRLLGSRFFSEFQGHRTARTKTYDANVTEEDPSEEPEPAFQASVQGLFEEAEHELDSEFVDAMIAAEDPDALTVQGFEEELATTTVAEVIEEDSYATAAGQLDADEVLLQADAKWGNLLDCFINQLSEAVRDRVRMVKSSVLWLSIEVVPGSTPLLFSKKEVQTAAVIDSDRAPASVPDSTLSPKPQHVSQASSRDLGSQRGERGAQHVLVESRSPLQPPAGPLSSLHCGGSADDATGKARGTKILFGKAMKGRTFADAYENEPAWVRWMLDHMATSTKMEHVAFITYVRRQAEEAEAVEAALLSSDGASHARGATPKATPKSIHKPPHEAHVWETTWDVVSDPEPSAVALQEQTAIQEQVTMLGERLSQMEASLSQIKNFLKTVPWEILAPTSSSDRSCVADAEGTAKCNTKDPAYVMFGMFVHGGIAGVTNDRYNSRELPNLVVPLEYPASGGSLQSLKPGLQVAEQTAWDVFQDSQLAYQRPVGDQLDVLEVYAAADSRLTPSVQAIGGKARWFTIADGDLRTIEGQRLLWDVLQETQPKHIWMSPDSRAWCSWSNLNAARGAPTASKVHQRRQEDTVHLQLRAQIFQWQVARGRHFHLEQPIHSKMLDSRINPVDYLVTVLAGKAQGLGQDGALDPNAAVSSLPNASGAKPDIEGWAPPPTPLHGPAFRNLDKESKHLLIRVHKSLGHPAPTVLSRHLQAAGYDKALVDGALEYQCDTCLESTEPRHQRPGKLPEPREFNDLVGVDGFYFKGQSGYRAYVIHALDETSCFHLGRRTQTRFALEAMHTLSECWFAWAGNPRQVYLDPAGEFRSDQVLERFQATNIKTFVTAAAWQQRGRIERHGDIAKDMLARLDKESPLVNDADFDRALIQVFQAKNALVRHRGYSPEQIVLGKSVQVPGSVTSDENLAAHTLAVGSDLEAEAHRQRLELRCAARKAFFEADNSQAIRRAVLRRSTPARGPYLAGSWVLYWTKKSSPNRLAAGRWHGPAKVICQEGQSVVWVAHGTTILRCAPENLRPASLREWQQLSSGNEEAISQRTGGASAYLDLTGSPPETTADSNLEQRLTSVDFPTPTNPSLQSFSAAREPNSQEDEIAQPEQELTPQVSVQGPESSEISRAPEVECDSAAPSISFNGQETPTASEVPAPSSVDASPESDEGLHAESILLASEALMGQSAEESELLTFTSLATHESAEGPPLAEDNLPFVEDPLECADHQAFSLEIPIKPRDLKKWSQESSPEQLTTLAAVGKRARADVRVKDLSREEMALFDEAKQKELQCWIQTSTIKAILRRKLNPAQILKSRWILTWKAPEPGEDRKRAKARLVVLGFQDPKLVEVMRDAPTLSREGRAIVLQTIASCRFHLSSFDIKTAFLRGKADEGNPLAMEPPPDLRKLLKLREDEVCQLVGNAYGRVDAPLLFYKELSKQLRLLGFEPHPLEPCVFLLKTSNKLRGILGVHVDDGVCGRDEYFRQKVEELQKVLPFGSRKHKSFIFTGIQLEQFPDFSIKASQSEYVHRIPSIDVGRPRRQNLDAPVNEDERTKLRGLIGSLQYAITHTRPDVAARLGEVQCQTTTATVQTLLLANKVLREAQEYHQVSIIFQAIPVDKPTFVAFGDASFASSKNLNSHQGVLICTTVSPLTWSAKKIPRVVRSTLSAEAYAMSKAVDLLGWVRALWGVIHIPDFKWQQPELGFKHLRTAVIVTDCKSLYDLVTRLAMPACEEYRTTLEVLLIKQRCQENACFRWVPTTLQAADCLTKAMDSNLLRAVLARGQFKLYDPSQTLEKDAQRKKAIEWLQSPPTS
ncbi:GIP [Symbiodinium sp. CCMP2592]|nr:GIP [Symbiodinium sp. CCMP2592]